MISQKASRVNNGTDEKSTKNVLKAKNAAAVYKNDISVY